MVLYVLPKTRSDCLVRLLRLAVRFSFVHFHRDVFYFKVAANECGELANKLRTFVSKEVGWEPGRDFQLIEKQVRKLRSICLGSGLCSREI